LPRAPEPDRDHRRPVIERRPWPGGRRRRRLITGQQVDYLGDQGGVGGALAGMTLE